MNSFHTPVLLIVFNRPKITKKIVEALSQVKPTKLYIAADGPRPNVVGEAEKCEETRRIAKALKWDCEVKTLFRNENLGCGLGPAEAINWFFKHEEQGIILEDDCLPNASFFDFCQELLIKYRTDTRIMQISGTNFHKGWIRDSNYSYYFSEIGLCWGWATWRRAWRHFDFHMKLYEELDYKNYVMEFPFYRFGRNNYIYSSIKSLIENRDSIDFWDIQWNFAQFINAGLSITPTNNLIKNIGLGDDATHTVNVDKKYSNDNSLPLSFPIKHPPFVIRDKISDDRYLKNFYSRRIIDRLRKRLSLNSN